MLITFLVSPYLQNYDYVVLLLPLVTLAEDAAGLDWLWLMLAYVVPLAGLAAFGRAANPLLMLSPLVLFIFSAFRLPRRSEPQLVP